MPSKRPMPTFWKVSSPCVAPPPAEGDVSAITAERDALRASLDAAEHALAALPGRDDAVEVQNADLRRRGSRRSPTPWSNRRACPVRSLRRRRTGAGTGLISAPTGTRHRRTTGLHERICAVAMFRPRGGIIAAPHDHRRQKRKAFLCASSPSFRAVAVLALTLPAAAQQSSGATRRSRSTAPVTTSRTAATSPLTIRRPMPACRRIGSRSPNCRRAINAYEAQQEQSAPKQGGRDKRG